LYVYHELTIEHDRFIGLLIDYKSVSKGRTNGM